MKQWVESITAQARLDTLIVVITGFVVLQTEAPALVEPALSVLHTGSTLPAGRVTQLPMFIFLYVVVYSLLRSVYPTWLAQPIHESAFVRHAVAGFGFVSAQFTYLLSNRYAAEALGPIVSLDGILPLMTYGVVGFVIFALSYLHTNSISFSSDSALAEPHLRLSSKDDPKSEWDDDLEQLRQSNHRRYIAQKIAIVIGTSAIGSLPVIFLGLFVGLFSRFYPVLEIIAVIRVVIHRLPLDRLRESSVSLPQVEEVFYEQLKILRTTSGMGMILTITGGLGLLVTLYRVPEIIGFVSWRDVVWAIKEFAESPSITTLGYTLSIGTSVAAQNAAAITPILMGVYGLWFLMRIAKRFPGFKTYVSDWESSSASTEIPARPRGFLLPLLPLGILYSHHEEHVTQYLGIALNGATFLVLWVAVVVVVMWTVVTSRTTESTDCVQSVQLEVFAPYLSLSAGAYLLAPNDALLSGTVGLYILSNVLFYSPGFEGELSYWWWVSIVAVIVPFVLLLAGTPFRWVIGLTGTLAGLLLVERFINRTIE